MNIHDFSSGSYELCKAYSFLETVTPLNTDCGRLCGGKCCMGGEKDGMWLFPREEKFFSESKVFRTFECADNQNYPALVCPGKCDRRLRPLQCRMFPLFPYAFRDENGDTILRILPDIRAREICPLRDCDITPAFYRAVRLAAAALIRNKEIADYLFNLTELLTYDPF